MARLQCITCFDITKTGVTGFFRADKLPFTDESGKMIRDKDNWITARNQNRNLETIIQILSLRTQIMDVTVPRITGDKWKFEFSVENLSVYCDSGRNDLNILKSDANNVPLLSWNKGEIKAIMTDLYRKNPNLMFEILSP